MTIEEAMQWCLENHVHIHCSEYAIASLDSDFGGVISHHAPAISIYTEDGNQIVPARCHHGWDSDHSIAAFIEAVESAKIVEEEG